MRKFDNFLVHINLIFMCQQLNLILIISALGSNVISLLERQIEQVMSLWIVQLMSPLQLTEKANDSSLLVRMDLNDNIE